MTNPTTPFGYAVAVSRSQPRALRFLGNYVGGLPCRSLPMRLTPIDVITWNVGFE